MLRRALSITFMLSLAVPAFAQSPKPVTIECITDGKTLSVTENNPNAAEALCEFTCTYTAADKQQHHTSKISAVVRPGRNTSAQGRVDGEPPYAKPSTAGSCTSWKCQTQSSGQLLCVDH